MNLLNGKILWPALAVGLGAGLWIANLPDEKPVRPAANATTFPTDLDPATGERAAATDSSESPAPTMPEAAATSSTPTGASAAGVPSFSPDGPPEQQASVAGQTSARTTTAPGNDNAKSGLVASVGGPGAETGSSDFVGVPLGALSENREIAVAVPPGERAPAVFYDETPRPEPQLRMLDEIARGFNEAIQREVPGYTPEEVWREARDWADERYMYFFGWDAWNVLHLRAAQEAVLEKEAMGQMSQRSYE